MSATTITITNVDSNALTTFPTYAACAADSSIGSAYYAKIAVKQDESVLILITNTHGSVAKDISILKGDQYAAANDDLSLADLAAAGVKVVSVESARYSNGGYIIVSGESADIKVAAIRLT